MAGVNKCAKDQETRPLPGALDLRSPDGAVKRGYARILLNLLVGEDGHLTRMGGFRRLGWDAPKFCNQDLHDPLLGIDNNSCPPPCVPPYDVYITGPSVVTLPSIVLHIVFSGHYNDVTYEMFRDGVSMGPPGPGPNFTVTESGIYVGKVVNNCGENSSPGFIVAGPPPDPMPTVTDPPNRIVERFAEALFPVTVTNATSIQWEFRANSSAAWVSADTYGGGSNTATFSANTHIVYTAAEVRVSATNASGTVYSRPGTLVVNEAARFISGNTSPPAGTDQTYALEGITADWAGADTVVDWDLDTIRTGCQPGATVTGYASKYVASQFGTQYPPEFLTTEQEEMAHSLLRQEIALEIGGGNSFSIAQEEWWGFSNGDVDGYALTASSGNYQQDLTNNLPMMNWGQGWYLNSWFCMATGSVSPAPPTSTERVIHITFPASGSYNLKATPTVTYTVNTISGGTPTAFVLPTVTLLINPTSGFIYASKSFICYTLPDELGFVDLISTFAGTGEYTASGWFPENSAGTDTYPPVFQGEPAANRQTFSIALTAEGARKVSAGQQFNPGAAWVYRYRAVGATVDSVVRVQVRNCAPTAPTTEVRWLRSTSTSIVLADIDNTDPNAVRRRSSATIAGDCGFDEDPTATTWCFICLPDNAGGAPRLGDGMVIASSGSRLVLAASANGGDQLPYNRSVNGWSYELVGGTGKWRVFRIINKTAGAITVRIAT